jgi:ATP-dependent DNA helicase UvrD/PcrA
MLFGSSQYNPPSRFLDEIPGDLVEAIEGNRRGSRRAAGGRSWDPGAGRDRIVEAALAPQRPQQSGADRLGLRIGDDVRHAKWGEGVILDLEGQGDKTEAVVRFPEVGEKRLLLAWAPLEKVTSA